MSDDITPLPIEEQKLRPSEITGVGAPPHLTWERFERICETLRETGLKYKSCEAHGVAYGTLATLLADKQRPIWKDTWNAAMELYRDELEEECIRRARDGVQEPVYYKGMVVGHITKYSDRLLEAQLRAERPEKYRDNVKVDADINGGVLLLPQKMTVADYLAQKQEAAQ